MSKLTLPIEIGRRYVRRDGKVVTAQAPFAAVGFANVGLPADGDGDTLVSLSDGMIAAEPAPLDLIADAPEEKPAGCLYPARCGEDGCYGTCPPEEPERPVGGYVGYADHWTPTTLPLPNYTEEPKTYDITDYADVLRAIADGKRVQYFGAVSKAWEYVAPEEAMEWIADRLYRPDELRIAPDTITINGREVPAPVRGEPEHGTPLWVARPAAIDLIGYFSWGGSTYERGLIKRGLIHLTEEAARQHAEALLSFTRREG